MSTLKIDKILHNNIINVLNFFNITDRSFFVGGMIRDHFLNKPIQDIDIAVEKIKESELNELKEHLNLTGLDFPVFRFRVLDSNQVEFEIELAVSRRERSTGIGHKNFCVTFGENVTIEDDLKRRDLTINSMAIPVNNLNHLVDPFGGLFDLNERILRHTSDAFQEDPLRIFRLARFLARFSDFTVHPSTIDLCTKINTTTKSLSGERVSQEVEKMFKSSKVPSIFFKFLKEVDNLFIWFPEIDSMIGIPQPEKHHGNNDVFDHTMETIDNASMFTKDEAILFGALFHDIGKILTPENILPAHHSHENNGLVLVNDIVKRLKLNKRISKVIFDSIKNHMKIGRTLEMRDKKVISMVSDLVRNNTFHDVIAVSHADRLRKGGLSSEIIKVLHFAEFVLREKLPEELVLTFANKNGLQCNQLVQSFRLKRLKECM